MSDQGENKVKFRDRKAYPVVWIILTLVWVALFIWNILFDGSAVDFLLCIVLMIISAANAVRWFIRRNHIRTAFDDDDEEDDDDDEDLAADI